MKKLFAINIEKRQCGEQITIQAWLHSVSILGKILFIRMWNRDEIVQVVARKQSCLIKSGDRRPSWKSLVACCRKGTILLIDGVVALNEKTKLKEIQASSIDIRSTSMHAVNTLFSEESKLSNRIVYLRNSKVINNFKLQSSFLHIARNILVKYNFIEVFTPILSQNTAEGARLFDVKGEKATYALCQSPQVYKQGLMCAGFQRYFQIATCFRDEDLRNDRLPEFHQLDLEMSFCSIKDIQKIFEIIIRTFLKKNKLAEKVVFEHINFDKCIKQYGTDKPDIRMRQNFNVFSDFCAFCIDEVNFSDMKEVVDSSTIDFAFYDDKDVIHSKGEVIKSFFQQARDSGLAERYLMIINSRSEEACNLMFRSRRCVLKCKEYKFLWIEKIPMFELKNNKIEVRHNPFCDTQRSYHLYANDIKNILKTPSSAFDLVLNGTEILGGSLREIGYCEQQHVLHILEKNDEKLRRFDFFIRMLQSGVPQHGGAALGIERFLCSITFEESIREFVAFPKSSSGKCSFFDSEEDNTFTI